MNTDKELMIKIEEVPFISILEILAEYYLGKTVEGKVVKSIDWCSDEGGAFFWLVFEDTRTEIKPGKNTGNTDFHFHKPLPFAH